jgi:superfamily II DNA/RNA helicase
MFQLGYLCSMISNIKSNSAILEKLGIKQLNPMQEEAKETIANHPEVVLISPTGTGKTLAFLMPIIEKLDPNNQEVQALIIVPSRELAIQIESVIREMGSGYKNNAVYGGRSFSKDKIELKHRPAILIGTPGRIADHLRRETFSTVAIRTLVLDEFDKSLEIGFETEMLYITDQLHHLESKILTSATEPNNIPKFVRLKNPVFINHSNKGKSQLKIKTVLSSSRDKIESLVDLLSFIGNEPGIIFCNFKDSIDNISEKLTENGISHGVFYGGMEQIDREMALIKFRNGTHHLLLATDLAARGIDIPELKFIIHFHLPSKETEFTHRNGRTARMNSNGTAYVLKGKNEDLPEFINGNNIEKVIKSPLPLPSVWKTLFITGGRRDKISKGDIAGLFFKQGKLKHDQLGIIEIKQEFSYAAVKITALKDLIERVDNTKLKNKKVRISAI